MKISVIIPTYKPKNYLWTCLDSICAQTLQKELFEIILVLNGCDEPWKSQIEDYLLNKKSTNIKFVQIDTPGVSNARNLGLDMASGDYIAFVDDDDFVSPSYLSELYSIVDENTIGISYTLAFHDGCTDKQWPYRITKEYEKCVSLGKQSYLKVKKYFSGPCMKLIPVGIIANRRFDVRFKNGEDSLFMFLLSDRMKMVDFTSNQAVYYRRLRENSAVSSQKSFYKLIVNCLKLMKEYTIVYFKNIKKYNLKRYITVILGIIHIILRRILYKK